MDIISKKNFYFLFSAIIIVPGIISLILFGLRPSIDFTGGSRIEYQVQSSRSGPEALQGRMTEFKVQSKEISNIISKQGVHVISVQESKNSIIVRTNPIDQKMHQKITDAIAKQFPNIKEKTFETVGPTIGNETKANAAKAVIFASFAITLFIAFAFRKVSKPVSSWKFGVCAIVALLHDVLLVIGVFSILGKLFGVEVDSLFITALLTVMGFSVHDTIVVFDRIRENLRKSAGEGFAQVVNNSILETFNRSLNTSLTVILVLVSLLLFGGETIRWFVVALLIGIVSGTYSSIFNASPLLVVWEEWDRKRMK